MEWSERVTGRLGIVWKLGRTRRLVAQKPRVCIKKKKKRGRKTVRFYRCQTKLTRRGCTGFVKQKRNH